MKDRGGGTDAIATWIDGIDPSGKREIGIGHFVDERPHDVSDGECNT